MTALSTVAAQTAECADIMPIGDDHRLGMGSTSYAGQYDGYDEPFLDGYRAGDRSFYYSATDHRFHREDGRHFRREAGPGIEPVHGHRLG